MKRAPMHRDEFHTVDNAEKSDAADMHLILITYKILNV